MVEGTQVDLETAFRIESRYLARLMTGTNAKAMINTFFFNMNAIKSGQSRPPKVRRVQARQGRPAGRRHDGRGHRLRAGQQRHCHRAERREPGQGRCRQGYSSKITAPRVEKGRMTAAEQSALLSRITATDQVNAELAGCDLIIEAVFERRDLKAKVTQEAEPLLAPGGFFASNTSTLPISAWPRPAASPKNSSASTSSARSTR
jgi:3-hydroxyacyl-CoA dehydrogenase/enoyl-CoA hydratase/3-hydroxybutyryl-CoA epimerase